jgi:hypothetical protein
MLAQAYASVRKEDLVALNYSPGEVLSSPDEMTRRAMDLHKAMILGNEYHYKVKILFQTEEGEMKSVETTVWYTSDKFVMLKGARTIPVQCIRKVIL